MFNNGWQVLENWMPAGRLAMTIRIAFSVILVILLAGPGGTVEAADRFVVQWKAADDLLPWLEKVEVLPYSQDVELELAAFKDADCEYPNGLRAEMEAKGRGSKWIKVRLAGDYGFLFSSSMLDEHAYLWLRDLGIFISSRGTWKETAGDRERNARLIEKRRKEPFVSCAEKYFQWTGFVEHEGRLDRKIWDFVEEKQKWPVDVRTVERVAELPEADEQFFTRRFPDLKYSRVYLGWPDHNDEFILWDNGKIGVSSRSVGSQPREHPDTPWQPRARGFSVQFGVGVSPRFREEGDAGVEQRLEDGHRLIVDTAWADQGIQVRQRNFAYPLDGEKVQSGVEPLLAWTGLSVTNSGSKETETYLGIEFTDEDFGGYGLPLPNLVDLTWREGGFYLLGELILISDPSLVFEEVPTSGTHKRFRALVRLDSSGQKELHFASLYRPISPSRLEEIRNLGYPEALGRTREFWSELEKAGAFIEVPDPLFNNLLRTFLPRITINSDLDLEGRSVLQTGPIIYNRVWHHVTCYAVADYLARLGYFDLAKLYLEPYFDWQGIPAHDSPAIQNWDGFFGAPEEQCPLVWLMYQGMIQWASARYFQLSADRDWLDQKLPALIKSMEWVQATRSQTKRLNADGSKPLNYGWFPPGRVTDGSHGTSIFSDANIWRGMEYMSQVLQTIGHPRAGEFRKETDDYRQDLVSGLRRAAAERPIVRLNDDTWVPYLPAYLEQKDGQIEPTRWYAAVVDGPWQGGIFDTQIFPSGSPENWWLLNFFEDTYSPMNPSLPDEPFWACHATEYLARDQVENFLFTLYSQSTTTMARETLTTYEHFSGGRGRVFELTGWAAGYWFRNFADMIARTVGDELWLMQATPRRWLKDGESIRVENLQTEFGPLSYTVNSKIDTGTITAKIEIPARHAPESIKIRFRVPNQKKIQNVILNSKKWSDVDSDQEWITIPGSLSTAEIKVEFGR